MMKRILLHIFFLCPVFCFGQYTESFNIADKGADPVTPFTTNLSGVNWSMALGTYVGTVSATPQYAKTVSGALEYRNTDKEVCFTSPFIGINTPPGPRTIAIDFDVVGIDVEDWIQVDYSVNQGAYVALGNQFGGGTKTVGVTGVAQNANFTGTITASGITGNNLKIKICATSSNTTELLKIFEIRVPESGTVVLPVTWATVNVRKKDGANEVTWTTHAEINNDHFEVERSIDNDEEFEMIGKVDGKGNTALSNDYSFIDKTINTRSSDVHYRLKQIDYDGKFDYSPIVSVRSKKASSEMATPNPFQNELTLDASKAEIQSGNITIMDIQGHLIKDIKIIDESDDSTTFDTTEFISGVYFIKFPSGKVTRVVKL
jgi:hypothetical protein